jgi:hypothetical protein
MRVNSASQTSADSPRARRSALTNSNARRSSLVAPPNADEATTPEPVEVLTTRGLVEKDESSLDDEIIRATGREEIVCAWLLIEMLAVRRDEKRQNRNSLGSLSTANGERKLNSFIRGTLKGCASSGESN